MYYPKESIPEIRAMNPDMKLVVMLREPVARAWSSYQYMCARGFETEADFLTAVALEEERKAAGWHHIWHYTSQSRYADQVAALLDASPASRSASSSSTTSSRTTRARWRGCWTFSRCRPAPGAGEGIPRVNISGRPRFAAAHAVLGWAVGNELVRTFVKERTSYRFRERIRRTLLRQDVLPADARARLEPLFADDLARLRAMLGADAARPG